MHPFLSAFLSARVIDRSGGHRGRVLKSLEEKKFVDSEARPEIESMQRESLSLLLIHAKTKVPRFRHALSAVDRIAASNAADILRTLPPMRRADLQADLKQFIAEGLPEFRDDATGGSTGTPMAFKVDRETQIAREASLLWANSLAGWCAGEKVAMLWGSNRDVQSASGRLRLAARWWIENMRWYDAFDMGEDQMEKFHEDLSAFRPHLLVAYAGSVFTFARFLKSRGWRPAYPLKAVITSAEVCAPSMRAMVEEVFVKPAFDRYGNREFGAIAAECEMHHGLHVNESDCLVEIDSADPFKEEGPILITYLKNYIMPFIRYDTGDVGRFESSERCRCGRTTIRLVPVTGRQSDTIRTASGKLIHGEYFTHILYGAQGVREFQFAQETPTVYRLLLVADRGQVSAMEPRWREEIMEALGTGNELRIEYVERIPPLPSGKRRFTVSKVAGI